jgi:hypothetical protein
VLGPQPAGGEAGIGDVGARLNRVQVSQVGGDPAAELAFGRNPAVAGDGKPDPRDAREQAEAGPVAAERVVPVQVEQRGLDVRAHVASDQHPGPGQEDRTVPGRVPVVLVHDRAGAGPVDLAGVQRLNLGEQGQVVPGRFLLDLLSQGDHGPGGEGGRAGRRVPGRRAERG